MRPKLRTFFKGGLTRRIDTVIPFFRFGAEEAHVIADMYVDNVRTQYMLPITDSKHIGDLFFDVTDSAVGELSKV